MTTIKITNVKEREDKSSIWLPPLYKCRTILFQQTFEKWIPIFIIRVWIYQYAYLPSEYFYRSNRINSNDKTILSVGCLDGNALPIYDPCFIRFIQKAVLHEINEHLDHQNRQYLSVDECLSIGSRWLPITCLCSCHSNQCIEIKNSNDISEVKKLEDMNCLIDTYENVVQNVRPFVHSHSFIFNILFYAITNAIFTMQEFTSILTILVKYSPATRIIEEYLMDELNDIYHGLHQKRSWTPDHCNHFTHKSNEERVSRVMLQSFIEQISEYRRWNHCSADRGISTHIMRELQYHNKTDWIEFMVRNGYLTTGDTQRIKPLYPQFFS